MMPWINPDFSFIYVDEATLELEPLYVHCSRGFDGTIVCSLKEEWIERGHGFNYSDVDVTRNSQWYET
jgi:hypothetical protein